jgi:aminoglycoside 6'-N-acetyltransferase I
MTQGESQGLFSDFSPNNLPFGYGYDMKIQQAELNNLQELAALACRLWPHHTASEMAQEYRVGMENPNVAFFLAYEGDTAVGFAQCQLRHDYVEGTESAPVGYLEGIFVAEQYRKQGTAKALLTACEDWARTKGCTEFASDCELTNTQSLRFHLNVGFTEANRIICFTKKL